MTLLLLEGFDWLETADLPVAYGAFTKYQAFYTQITTIEEAGGRNGDKSLKITPGAGASDHLSYNSQGYVIPTSVTAGATLIVGFAVKFVTAPSDGDTIFAAISSGGGVTTNKFNVLLQRRVDGTVIAGKSIGNSAALTQYTGASGATVLAQGSWYYIEMKFVSDNSVGSVEVRINGIVEFTATSLDTLFTDDSYGGLYLMVNTPLAQTPTVEYDDIYICDTNGSINNDYLGDVQVKALFPDGNGNTSDFTGSDANSVDNYLHVDDGAAPDDDSSYSEDGTTGNKDLYTFDNLPSGASDIKAIAVKTLGKKTGAGGPDLKNVVRTGTTEADSSILGLGVSYLAKQTIQELDPDTAVAWIKSGVDAMEAGVKVE